MIEHTKVTRNHVAAPAFDFARTVGRHLKPEGRSGRYLLDPARYVCTYVDTYVSLLGRCQQPSKVETSLAARTRKYDVCTRTWLGTPGLPDVVRAHNRLNLPHPSPYPGIGRSKQKMRSSCDNGRDCIQFLYWKTKRSW